MGRIGAMEFNPQFTSICNSFFGGGLFKNVQMQGAQKLNREAYVNIC